MSRAGRPLDELLAEDGLAREDVFATNPLAASPSDRGPHADDVARPAAALSPA